ncbi:MAG: class I tRNA ligase family protein, partial [Deltaproteobacteria bacterium]|nr:class I tRNA ligase family protein [Deltaproteobacteria bacterium]
FHFNTAIAAVMELVNAFNQAAENLERDAVTQEVFREAVENILLLLNPMVPHLAEELWEALGHNQSLQLCCWPQAQAEAMEAAAFTLVIQVNGKVRGKVLVPASASDEEIKNFAVQDANIEQKWLKGQTPKKMVLAKNRKLINIVI